jgi:hypothetical protein
MFTRPSLGIAEVAWRWSIGFAGLALSAACLIEYLDTLPVTNGDLLFLRSRQPALIFQALVHIFRGSAPRLVEALLLVAIALAVAWIVLGSYGRAATVKALLAHFRPDDGCLKVSGWRFWRTAGENWRLRSLVGLNVLRVALTVAAVAGCIGALLMAGAMSSDRDPAPGSGFLVFLLTCMLVWIAWSMLNWFLSVAAVFVVRQGRDTFGSIAASVDLCRRKAGSVFAAGTWFGLAHVASFFVATSVVAFPFAFLGVLPGAFVAGGVLLITLLYLALADFLYVGRLGAYVAILELPEVIFVPPSPQVPLWPGSNQQSPATLHPGDAVDKNETILSDIEQQAEESAIGSQDSALQAEDEGATGPES